MGARRSLKEGLNTSSRPSAKISTGTRRRRAHAGAITLGDSPQQIMQKIPEEALRFQFIRASGPGGQHVNKTSTAVQLRVDLARTGLPAPVRERLMRLAGQRANQSGEIVITAGRFRSQQQNRRDALARLNLLQARAWRRPKQRIPTQTPKAAKTRRLRDKKLRGRQKLLRQPPAGDG